MHLDDGQIGLCPYQGCHFTCCDFAADNFIALYPGELEEAGREGKSVAHLYIVADAHGGNKAVCHAKDKSCCDGGYKPLDCASYPFFPTVNDRTGQIQVGLKGGKCPLQKDHLANHQRWVAQRWQRLLASVPGLRRWIRQTRLVGYIRWPGSATGERVVQ